MTLKNYTPHPCKIYDKSGKNVIMEIEPEGVQVRLQEKIVDVGTIEGVPVVRKTYIDSEGLPAEEAGMFLIVSVLVLQVGTLDRSDLLAPDTGPDSVVRDGKGNILGVRRFQV